MALIRAFVDADASSAAAARDGHRAPPAKNPRPSAHDVKEASPAICRCGRTGVSTRGSRREQAVAEEKKEKEEDFRRCPKLRQPA
jgi:hypothetical protein